MAEKLEEAGGETGFTDIVDDSLGGGAGWVLKIR